MLEFILSLTISFTATNAMLGSDFAVTHHEEMSRRHESLEACNSMAGVRALGHYMLFHDKAKDGVNISHTCVPVVKENEL